MTLGKAFPRHVLELSFVAVSLLAAGCQVPQDEPNTPEEPTEITVLLANDTDMTVDPHLYVSPNKLSADDLFADETNQFSDFDGSPLLNAGAMIPVAFDCNDLGTIGSQEAEFTDLEAWEAGKSAESPVIQIGESVEAPVCGEVLIFHFFTDIDGVYHTEWLVTDPDVLQQLLDEQ